jgi:hypothetical protein
MLFHLKEQLYICVSSPIRLPYETVPKLYADYLVLAYNCRPGGLAFVKKIVFFPR